jgi:hypothetical protein
VVRVGFFLESTQQTLECLLNPISLIVKRTAGVVPEYAPSGLFSRSPAADYPLLYTGGGMTELYLELLFDAPLHAAIRSQNAGAAPLEEEPDVRDLTGPFFNLSENATEREKPPIARFIWGKAWNIRGIVAAVSERLEHFSNGGVPHRSWMSMRFLRVIEPSVPAAATQPPALDMSDAGRARAQDHFVVGSGGLTTASSDRMDLLASRYYGDPSMWRSIAQYNNVDDPSHIAPGTPLRIPPTAASST